MYCLLSPLAFHCVVTLLHLLNQEERSKNSSQVSVILELNRQKLFGLVGQFWDLGHMYKDKTGRYFKFRYLSVGENQILYQTQT